MGRVYRARDTRLPRDVAIKVLTPHLAGDGAARERLRREAFAAAALDHPFICKIFEIGDEGGTLFLAMEYIEGETLHDRLRNGPPAAGEALRIAGEIAEALEAAHARRILHRDLKPSNVMLTPQGRVKVMDFGLAKQLQSAGAGESGDRETAARDALITEAGVRLGTPGYMSPEQVLGDRLDERSDVFSFGIVLCELLTGQHPFRRPSPGSMMTAIVREPPSLSDISGSVSILIQRLLAKAPSDRYGTISEVRKDLDRLSSSSAERVDRVPRPRGRAMVGRDAERAELLRGLEDAIAGHGSIVLVGGEPGIGKTRLAQEVIADARERGFFGLVGHCYEGEGAPPYVPFVETLEYAARVVPPAAFRRALGDAAPEVAKLMPELRRLFSDIPPPIELPPEQQRRFLFNAYLEFTQRSCAITPMVVVLEDLHWADEPTLQLLQHLAQAVPALRLFVLGTYRDVELDVTRPFARTLETLLRERLASRIALRRLGAGDVESMLRSLGDQPPPSSLSRILFEETEGNPFFVEEVFQHLAEEGRLFDATGKWRSDLRAENLRVPESIRLVVGRRFERLSERARRVMTTAAILGRTFSSALLEAIEAGGPDEVLDAVEEAERAHLVVAEPTAREPRYRFAHELIRQTLADGLSLPRRQRLHARVAEAIERVYEASLEKHAPALAYHLYQAGAAAEAEKTSTYLLLASDQARAAAAHEDSLARLDDALSLWQGKVSGRVADIHSRRAAAFRSLGRIRETVDTLESAIAMFRDVGDFDRMAASANDLGWVHAWNADLDAALEVVRRTFEQVAQMPPKVACRLLLLRASTLSSNGDPEGGFETLRKAQAILRSLDDPELGRESARIELFLLWHAMRLDRAIEIAQDATMRSRAAGDVWSEIDTAFVEPLALLYCGRPREAARLVEERRELADRVGHHGVLWGFKLTSAVEAISRGELDSSAKLAVESVDFGKATGGGWSFVGVVVLGEVYFLQGRSEEAFAHLREAARTEPKTYLSGYRASSLLWALAHEGDGDAEAVLGEVSRRLPKRGRTPTFGDWFALAAVVEALALLGRREEAAALIEPAEDFVGTGVQYLRSQISSTIAGIAAACAREWSRSESHHQLAIRQADAAYRVSQPHARLWYADMLLSRNAPGDRERARSLLSEALSLYESMGMPGFARRTSARLAATSSDV